MEEGYDAEKCALELILLSLRKMHVLKQSIMLFNVNTWYIEELLYLLSEHFSDLFKEIFNRHSLTYLDPEDFATYVLRICLKMSRETVPLTITNIMLACAFILELVKYIGYECECSLITVAAWKCLIILLRRKLNAVFLDAELRHQFIELITDFIQLCVDEADVPPFHLFCENSAEVRTFVRMVRNCNVLDQQINLTTEEEEILATEDLIEQESENLGSVPECNWCGQNCGVFSLFLLRMHKNVNASNYRALYPEDLVLRPLYLYNYTNRRNL